MKQRDLLNALRDIAKSAGVDFVFVRPGSDHDQYRIGEQLVPIPRHREIVERTARGIIKDAAKYLEGRQS